METPTPRSGELLAKVLATTVTAGDGRMGDRVFAFTGCELGTVKHGNGGRWRHTVRMAANAACRSGATGPHITPRAP